MKKLVFRFLAYVLAGTSLAAAAWVLLSGALGLLGLPVPIVLGLAVVGIIAAVVLLVRASNVMSQGIRLNPPWAVVAMDGVCVIASAIAAISIIDGYADWLAGVPPLLMEPLVADVVVFMYLPAAIVLALLVTTSGGQSIVIDKAGLIVAGSFGAKKATWDEIKALMPDDEYVAATRVGVAMPIHLRANLEIEVKDGETITVYQPGLKATAKNILARMKEHAPSRLLKDLNDIEAAWL